MKTKLTLLALLAFAAGCNNNHAPDSNAPATTAQVKQRLYIVRKEDLTEDKKLDSTFLLDSTKITVSISGEYKGDYPVRDTNCYRDTFFIYAYKDKVAHITLQSGTSKKEVVITKDFMIKSLKKGNLSQYVLYQTSIDSIDTKKKEIIFTTSISPISAGDGWDAFYSVTPDGQVNFIKSTVHNFEGD
jgi:hypothetical protein